MNSHNGEKRGLISKYRVIQGVGGRQKETHMPPNRGGYLDNCTHSDFLDPRIEELRQIRLPQMWIDMANAIGIDSFLKVWEMLDSASEDRELYIPAHSKYLKLQRDLAIQQLSREGHSGAEIISILSKKMNIRIKKSQIYRAINA